MWGYLLQFQHNNQSSLQLIEKQVENLASVSPVILCDQDFNMTVKLIISKRDVQDVMNEKREQLEKYP